VQVSLDRGINIKSIVHELVGLGVGKAEGYRLMDAGEVQFQIHVGSHAVRHSAKILGLMNILQIFIMFIGGI